MNGTMTAIQAFFANPSMVPAWAMLLAKVTLILGVGWLLHGMLGRANPRWRVLAWRLAAVGVLALPLTLWLGSPIRLRLALPAAEVQASSLAASRIQPQPEPPETEQLIDEAVPPARAPLPERDVNATAQPAPRAAQPAATHPWLAAWTPARGGVALWLAGAVLLALRWFVGWRRLSKLVRASRPATQDLATLARQVAGDLGCRAAELRLAECVSTPLLAGWRRPVLLLPARMAGADYRAELPAIITHEFSHLRSGDVFWTQLIGALRMALWFHPLAWGVGRAHAAACEEVSDAVAAAAIGDAGAYARTLARVAVELAELPSALGGIAMARVPEIMQRLDRLRRCVFSSPLSRGRAAAFMACCMLGLFALGGLTIAPRAQVAKTEPAPAPAPAAPGAEQRPTASGNPGFSEDTAKPVNRLPVPVTDPIRPARDPLPAGAALRLGGGKLQQPGLVEAVAVSPDGKLIASGGPMDATIRIWDATTGERIKDIPLSNKHSYPAVLAFSPDGRMLAAVFTNPVIFGRNGIVDAAPVLCLWTVPTFQILYRKTPLDLKDQSGSGVLVDLAFAPDGKTLVTSEGNVFRLWEAVSGREIRHLTWRATMGQYGHGRPLVVSPDGKNLAVGGPEGSLCIGAIDSNQEPLKITTGYYGFIGALAFSADGKMLISGGQVKTKQNTLQGVVKVWDSTLGIPSREFETDAGDPVVHALALAPDQHTLAVGGVRGGIGFWDLETGRKLRSMQESLNHYSNFQMAFTPDGKRLVSGGQGEVVGVWDANSGRRLFYDHEVQSYLPHPLAFSPDGRILAVGSLDSTLRLWDTRSGRMLRLIGNGYRRPGAGDAAFSPDGKYLAASVSSDDGMDHSALLVWDTSTWKEVFRPAKDDDSYPGEPFCFFPQSDILTVRYCPLDPADTKMVSSIRFWNVKTAEKIAECGNSGELEAINISPDGHTLAIVNIVNRDQASIRFWDIAQKKDIFTTMTGAYLPVAAISANQRIIALSSQPLPVYNPNGIRGGSVPAGSSAPVREPLSISVWDIPRDVRSLKPASLKPRLIRGIDGNQPLNQLVISADGKIMASRNRMQTIQLWDAIKGVEAGRIDLSNADIGESEGFNGIALSPDGKTLAAGMSDGTVLLWPVESILKKK